MAFRVVFTPLMRQDLADTLNYFVDKVNNVVYAQKFMDRFEELTVYLSNNPHAYAVKYGNIYRQAMIDKYAVLYCVDDDDGVVRINRVLHGSRDISNLL